MLLNFCFVLEKMSPKSIVIRVNKIKRKLNPQPGAMLRVNADFEEKRSAKDFCEPNFAFKMNPLVKLPVAATCGWGCIIEWNPLKTLSTQNVALLPKRIFCEMLFDVKECGFKRPLPPKKLSFWNSQKIKFFVYASGKFYSLSLSAI